MPYATIEELPPAVRHHLPKHAQEIFRAAFNAAWESHADRGRTGQEETAFRVAWAAIKKHYRKAGGVWSPK